MRTPLSAPLALALALAACAGPRVEPAVAPRGGAVVHGTPVEIVDEVARFRVPEIPEAGFAIGDDGSVVVAHVVDDASRAWVVEAFDPRFVRRWRTPIDGWLAGLEVFPDGRVLVLATEPGRPDLQATVLARDGRPVARAAFTTLVGEPCRKPNRYWLARAGDTIVAQVACGGRRKRVRLDRELRVVRTSDRVSYGRMAAPDAELDARGDQLVLVRDGHREVLAWLGPRRTGALPWLAALDRDAVVAMSLDEWRDARARPRFAAHGVVMRRGERRWTVGLVVSHRTDEPTTITGVAATRDGVVLVALEYGRAGRASGARLPPARDPPGTGFPELARTLAVAELDAETGAARRVLVLQPATPWRVLPFARTGATPDHVVISSGDEVRVFARRGRVIAPIAAARPVRVPPVPHAVAPLEPARVTALAAAWAKVCGPRVVPKRPSPCRIETVAIGKDGTVAVAGGYYRANQLGSTRLPARAFEAGVIAVFAPDGTLRWHETLGTSWHNGIDQVLVRDDGAVIAIGHHGQHLAIGGHRLPDRVVPRSDDGQDLGFHARSGFVAVFEPAGRVALLEDLDVLAYGDRSSDPERACAGQVVQGAAPDEVWLRAECAGGTHRIRLRGTTVTRTARSGPRPKEAWPRTITARGELLDGHEDRFTGSLLVEDGRGARRVPVFAGRLPLQRFVAPAREAWWVAANVSALAGEAWADSLQVARVTAEGTAEVRELARGTRLGARLGARIDGLTTDDRGRPIVSIVHDRPFVLAGHRLEVPPADPEAGRSRGRVFVRLTTDGSAIDRVIVPAGPRGDCAQPARGNLTSIAARGERLAITMSFELGTDCRLRDEGSSVLVYDLEPGRGALSQ